MKTKIIRKNICWQIALVLFLVTVIPAFPAYAEDTGDNSNEESIAETSVSGIAYSRNPKASVTVKDTIYVSNSGGRKVELQLYSTSQKKYITRATFKPNETNGKTVLVYPKQIKQKTRSTWRVYIAGNEEYLQYISPKIKVTTSNVKSVSLSSSTACLYCVDDGKVIYTKNMNARKKQASTTKIMTALLIMQQTKFTSKAKVSKSAAHTAWGNLYLKVGDIYYVKNMFYALLVASSNEAANVLAQKNSGSTAAFVKKMNKKAKEMGLTNTQYKNTHGLDASGHYTSAYDLARLTATAYKYKAFRTAISKKSYKFKSLRYKQSKSVHTTDKILGYTKAFKGGKTGYDTLAKFCFSGVYVYKGKTYIASTLGSSSSNGRWNDNKKLYQYIKNTAVTAW